jgi:hypothetical protein
MGDESNINAILPSALKHELFTLKVGDVSGAYPLDNGIWVIAKLDAIHLLADKTITDKDLDGLRNEMSEQYSDELMQLYLANLRRKFPIEVNQAALNSVLK